MEIFVYGDVSCRGLVTIVKEVVELDVIIEARNFIDNEDQVGLDDFLDEMVDKSKYLATVVSLFIFDPDFEVNLAKLQNGESVGVMGEEELFGYANSKDDAIVAYTKENLRDNGEW